MTQDEPLTSQYLQCDVTEVGNTDGIYLLTSISLNSFVKLAMTFVFIRFFDEKVKNHATNNVGLFLSFLIFIFM